jgi:hypothetical protein
MTLADLQRDLPLADLPWVREFVVGADGEVEKVVIELNAFRALLAEVEDRGLLRAMAEVEHETPVDRATALATLDSD